MYKADYHIHSNFSQDSTENFEDIINYSIQLGLQEIALTDHFELNENGKIIENSFPIEKYFEDFYFLQNKYKNKIKLVLGAEISLWSKYKNEINKFLSSYKFDFIIGSMHYFSSENGAHKDIHNTTDFFNGKSKEETYLKYYETVLDTIETFDNFSVYGHLDYIQRYAKKFGNIENPFTIYSDFPEILDKILITLIKKNKGLEINTSGFKYGLNILHPHQSILKRYKQLGGEILTIGSDAHTKKFISNNFSVVYTELKKLGFNKITTFKNLNPSFIKIL